MPNSLKYLLPCPFCGGEAMAQKMILLDRWSISCTNIECIVDPIVIEPDHDAAITAWNTRAPIAEGGGDGEYSQGVMGDGAAILHNGIRMTIDEIVAALNRMPAIESLSRQGGEDLDWLRPFAWTSEQDAAWHRELPDISKSFDALIAEVRRCRGSRQTRASEAGDWVLVPREPTDEMLNASQEEMCRWSARTYHNDDEQTAIYKAMLAAAPAPGGG